MNRLILKLSFAVLLAGLCLDAAAQAPAFRNKGYKGNIGIETFQVFPGITTSHGYMFNSHHYLGGGFTTNVAPYSKDANLFITPFIEYQAYILDKNSTPVVGGKILSFARIPFDSEEHIRFLNGFAIAPQFGWSWGIGSQKQFGIMPYISAELFLEFAHGLHFYPMPAIGVVFEF